MTTRKHANSSQKNLASEGISTECVLDGLEAFNAIQMYSPDVILLDILLPKTSGAEILESIRSDPLMHDVPVIIISSRSSAKEKAFYLSQGADDFINKPILKEELITSIERILTIKTLTHQLSMSSSQLAFEQAKRKVLENKLEIINRQEVEFENYLLVGELAEEIRKDPSKSIENLNIAHNISGLTVQALLESIPSSGTDFNNNLKQNHLNNINESQKQLETTIENLKRIDSALISQIPHKEKSKYLISRQFLKKPQPFYARK